MDCESTRELSKRRLDGKLQLELSENTTGQYNLIKRCLKEAALGFVNEKRSTKPYSWDEDIEKEIGDKNYKHKIYPNKTEDNKTFKGA